MNASTTIYVRLLDEAVDVWRPVDAQRVGGSEYLIISQPYDPEIERWQFVPGDTVVCEQIEVSEGTILAATRPAP